MIKINNNEYKQTFFPDGTSRIKIDELSQEVEITWKYESDNEFFQVLAITEHFKELNRKVSLKMPYIPNARMDRVKNQQEVFTLKYFCKLINQAGFEKVKVLDAHSSVSLALLDKVEEMDIKSVIEEASLNKLSKDIIIYFPDEGSQKRYSTLFPEYRFVTGMKKRDWDTGKIQRLEVLTNGIDLKNKTVLMIDDIISYGGSLYYSALRLKELGVDKIYAYATHTENSILDAQKGTLIKLLNNKVVEKLFTTDSIFTGNNENIEFMEV